MAGSHSAVSAGLSWPSFSGIRTPNITPASRSQTSSRSSRPSLEILPDTRFIVFHGNEHEASSVKFTGTVRLHTPEAMSIQRPRICLEGKRRISWYYMGGIGAAEVVDKKVFWEMEQKLGVESTHKVKAGTIEWPFELDLSPSMPESVEGLKDTYIAYHLHATVSRPGWSAKDISAHEHIRIVRTLGQESMETTRSRVNADIWADKISYSISIPTDAIIFGTSITADVELSPIKKGLRLGKVELLLQEQVVKRVQASEVPDLRGDRSKTDETEVAKTEMEFPEHSRILYDNETADNPMLADEMYKFKATLPLPKSLNVCRQDVDSHNINITHRFKLMVNIHNPEGHTSQLVCRLPVKLFISPNLPVDERNEVSVSTNGVSDAELNSTETTIAAPPVYGRHQLDQIFSDIDPSSFMSRAGSASATPAGILAQSRRTSNDNLVSLNGVVSDDDPALHNGSALSNLLHSRLMDLQQGSPNASSSFLSREYSPTGGNSPAAGVLDVTGQTPPFRAGSLPLASSSYIPHNSAPLSRRTSTEHGSDIHSQDYNTDSLARVPSYGAALRNPSAITPLTEIPPSYVEATSRPPSPSATQMQRPGQAHLRSRASSPQRTSASQHTIAAAPIAGLSISPQQQTPRIPSVPHDDPARLRMLRARS